MPGLPWLLPPQGAFPGCLPREGPVSVQAPGTVSGSEVPRRASGALGLRARTHSAPGEAGAGVRGRAQLCVTGSLPSRTGRTLGPLLQPVRALGFGLSPGAAVAPGARWGPPGQGWDHVCVPPAEPAAAAAGAAPPQAQGGGDPEDAGVRAHDPLPRVLGRRSALRPPQPPREPEQRRNARAPRPAAQGGARRAGPAGAGPAGGPTLPAGLVPPSWEVRGACRRVGPAPGVCDGPVLRVPQTGFGPGLEACSWGSVQHPLVLDSDDLFFSPPGHPPAAPPDP